MCNAKKTLATDPTIVGSVEMPDPANGVCVSGGYAYVAKDVPNPPVYHSYLTVVDISDPESPVIVGNAGTF